MRDCRVLSVVAVLRVGVGLMGTLCSAEAAEPSSISLGRQYVDFSRWKALSVGGGGAVMSIETSARPGTLYVSADMEGIYRSDDYGNSWHIRTRDLGNVFTRVIKAHPVEEDTVYLGTMTGLWKSTDGAASWQMLGAGTDLDGMAVQQIVFNPLEPSVLYATPGLGSRENAVTINDNVRRMGLGAPEGVQSHYFKSSDGGASWEKIRYTDKDGDITHTVFDIAIDPADRQRIFLASTLGVYRSFDGGATWTELSIPDTNPRGIVITPDGQWVYGSFRGEKKDGTTGGIFIARSDDKSPEWVRIDQSMPERGNYWPIRLDPFDPSGRTLFAGSNDKERVGLFRGVVTFGKKPSAEWRQYLKGYVHTAGWLDAHANEAPIVRRFGFSKPAWPTNSIWASTGMSLYSARLEEDRDPVWQEKYSEQTSVSGRPFFRGRGFESTFVYDVAVSGNYIASGMADHGFLESYDGGTSWREVNFFYPQGAGKGSNSRTSVLQFVPGHPDKLLAGLGWGYGSGDGGVLYSRDVDPSNPDVNAWTWLAGGPAEKNGLVNEMILSFAFDPGDADRLYVGLQKKGIYATDHFGSLLEKGAGEFYPIAEGVIPPNIRVYEMKLDPLDSTTLYAATSSGLFVGHQKSSRKWEWKKPLSGGVLGLAVTISPSGKSVVLAVGRNETSQDQVWLSGDQGESWVSVLKEEEIGLYGGGISAGGLDRYVYFFPEIEADATPGGNIYVSVTTRARRSDGKVVRGNVNFLSGVLGEENRVTWRSMLGGLVFSHANRLRIVQEGSCSVLYNATRGAGVFKREVSRVGNGGFELDCDENGQPDYWTFSESSLLEKDKSVEGRFSAKIADPSAGAVFIISDDFTVPPSGRGELGYAVSSYDGALGATGELIVKDCQGNEISRIGLEIPRTVKGGWTDVRKEMVFPSNAALFCIRFSGDSSGKDPVWVDDVFLEAREPTRN